MLSPLLFCLVLAPLDVTPPVDFVKALGQGWTYEARMNQGGAGGLEVRVTNPGRPTVLRLDAGLVFYGPDDVQPPVVMEDQLVEVPRGEFRFVVPSPGCGEAKLMAPSEGMAFNGGVAHISEELGRVMDRMNAGVEGLEDGLQDLVWVYTNDHHMASVYVEEAAAPALQKILEEEVAGYESPGYAVEYREPAEEDAGRFTGEAMAIRCDIEMDIARQEDVRVVMVQPDGDRIEMMGGLSMRPGPHKVVLTMAFEGYPPGAYQLLVEGERTGQAHFEREVWLDGGSEG